MQLVVVRSEQAMRKGKKEKRNTSDRSTRPFEQRMQPNGTCDQAPSGRLRAPDGRGRTSRGQGRREDRLYSQGLPPRTLCRCRGKAGPVSDGSPRAQAQTREAKTRSASGGQARSVEPSAGPVEAASRVSGKLRQSVKPDALWVARSGGALYSQFIR